MLWAIVSSIFVFYLYRELNAADVSGTVAGSKPTGAIDTALAILNERISALEIHMNDQARETTP